MQAESYVVLRPFMVEELGLKGSELVAYALIYGFSQDGESWFTGSSQYVADWCGIARRNAINVLQKLTERDSSRRSGRVRVAPTGCAKTSPVIKHHW